MSEEEPITKRKVSLNLLGTYAIKIGETPEMDGLGLDRLVSHAQQCMHGVLWGDEKDITLMENASDTLIAIIDHFRREGDVATITRFIPISEPFLRTLLSSATRTSFNEVLKRAGEYIPPKILKILAVFMPKEAGVAEAQASVVQTQRDQDLLEQDEKLILQAIESSEESQGRGETKAVFTEVFVEYMQRMLSELQQIQTPTAGITSLIRYLAGNVGSTVNYSDTTIYTDAASFLNKIRTMAEWNWAVSQVRLQRLRDMMGQYEVPFDQFTRLIAILDRFPGLAFKDDFMKFACLQTPLPKNAFMAVDINTITRSGIDDLLHEYRDALRG